jgi:GNAT superfamily N-acetyltransferase
VIVDVSTAPGTVPAEYARIPIAFEVRSIFEVSLRDGGLAGMGLEERRLDAPWIKDYDAIAGEGPAGWARRFELSKWEFLTAWVDGRPLGAAALAAGDAGIRLPGGQMDRAILWDIRAVPSARGHGVGAALFRAAEARARLRGCRQLWVETQNVNVPACRFYVRLGCRLGALNRFAYPDLPDEVQLLWYKDLAGDTP